MDKLGQDTKNKLHFWWLITLIVCIIATYSYMKAKAADNYKTILRIASQNCNLETVKFLVENLLDINVQIPKLTALHYAAEEGCAEVVKFLVEKGVDINATKYERWTPLHAATYEGKLEIIRFLLDKGSDPTIRDTDGKTPRKIAVLRSRHNKDKPYDEIIKLLAEAEDRYESTKSNH
ncbi:MULTISPECIES: ankyrin repeat domain-containing protein [unclassified Wolbachia]|uniref:ankyrin repeat domain-containing protein n=1 Tax=unclassified Wolbachia TaxID=2640676 RepID=UPI0002D2540D|nr:MULTISPECIES: ankyrin repeat domain-containing protein [unclassified Wolbachia]AGJ99849.1 Ankyrin repeat domain protein [Wolbachia endosymbiont of Drosophila simulans wHa]MDV6249395.1 ankyrin repeat domain-containing protein [Wolbachia endosymbiont of Zaprionus taronus]TLW88894.1 ankyrin repeat domain-containing protein [Wolbachia endosymbiont of Drosophila santomea]